MLIEG
jgi:nucleotide-binding universal stress UspA family protein